MTRPIHVLASVCAALSLAACANPPFPPAPSGEVYNLTINEVALTPAQGAVVRILPVPVASRLLGFTVSGAGTTGIETCQMAALFGSEEDKPQNNVNREITTIFLAPTGDTASVPLYGPVIPAGSQLEARFRARGQDAEGVRCNYTLKFNLQVAG